LSFRHRLNTSWLVCLRRNSSAARLKYGSVLSFKMYLIVSSSKVASGAVNNHSELRFSSWDIFLNLLRMIDVVR